MAPRSILMRRRRGTAGREYVFCCGVTPTLARPPAPTLACRINSWHEHNVRPLVVPGSVRRKNNNGIHWLLLKAALRSDPSQTPCDLTSAVGLGTAYVTWGRRRSVWSPGEKVEGRPDTLLLLLLRPASQEGFSALNITSRLSSGHFGVLVCG